MRNIKIMTAVATAVISMALFTAPAASASVTVPGRERAANWAMTYARGCSYVWGGNGPCPSGYDCSGLVVRAYRAAGVTLPRVADDIVHSAKIRQIPAYQARKGDIAAWGYWYQGRFYAQHVMLSAYLNRWVFGELDSGHVSGQYRVWGSPLYFRVTGAG